MEKTFVMVKPDGVQRALAGEIICRLEKKGFQLVGMKLMQMSRELAGRHYAEHQGKPFFDGLVDFITSGPVVAMVWEGKNVVRTVRDIMGATNPADAAPGTIRGQFAVDIARNVIHGSDSVQSAEREIALYFRPEEILTSRRTIEPWLYE